MRIALSISLILCTTLSVAQSVLNGSFEGNSLDTDYCNISMTYEAYDSTVFYSKSINPVISHYSYSMIHENCILPYSTEVWGPSPQDGNWFLALYGSYRVHIPNELFVKTEGSISLALSAPLELGKTYRLSYYIQAFPQYPPYPSEAVQSYFVGLTGQSSSDIGTSYLEVGISENDSTFGELIHTSNMPPQAQWLKQSLDFSPSLPAEHISCRIFVADESLDTFIHTRYVVFIDSFVLSEPNAIEESNTTPFIYPNPTQGIVHLQHPLASEVVLHDLMGKEQFRQTLSKKENSLNIEHLPRGVYLLSLWHEGQQLQQEKLFKL